MNATYFFFSIVILFNTSFLYSNEISNRSLPLVSESVLINAYNKDKLDFYNIIASIYSSNKYLSHDYIEYYKQMFEPEVVLFNLKCIIIDNNSKKELLNKVYFNRNNLFVISERNYGHPTYNYYSTNERIYSWITGENIGDVFKRKNGDTIHFLTWLIDPSTIRRSLYDKYINNSDQCILTIENHLYKVMFKQPFYGITGFSYYKNPFWLYASYHEQGSIKTTIISEKPIIIKYIPDTIQLPANIKWNNTDLYINSREDYM